MSISIYRMLDLESNNVSKLGFNYSIYRLGFMYGFEYFQLEIGTLQYSDSG